MGIINQIEFIVGWKAHATATKTHTPNSAYLWMYRVPGYAASFYIIRYSLLIITWSVLLVSCSTSDLHPVFDTSHLCSQFIRYINCNQVFFLSSTLKITSAVSILGKYQAWYRTICVPSQAATPCSHQDLGTKGNIPFDFLHVFVFWDTDVFLTQKSYNLLCLCSYSK